MKKNYWQDLVNKHLVGKKIVKVEWLSPKETERVHGWDQQPCEIYLDDGTVLSPSMDDEGNDAGAIFTNLKELPCLPVFRDYQLWAIGISDRPYFFIFSWVGPAHMHFSGRQPQVSCRPGFFNRATRGR